MTTIKNPTAKEANMLSDEFQKILYGEFLSKFDISSEDRRLLLQNAVIKTFKKGEIIYPKDGCYGYAIVTSGEIRGYISTSNFKEITVFNLKNGDSCILCAFCSLGLSQLELNLQIMQDTQIILIPKPFYKQLRERYPQVANHTLELISRRFSSVMNAMEQALFTPLTGRIMKFLEQNGAQNELKITHEQIANHLGSAREAVSRVLKELENKGAIKQKRGVITLVTSSHI